MFPQGNTKLTLEQQKEILSICGIKDTRTLSTRIECLKKEWNWLWYDARTKNYNLRSFSKICELHDLEWNYGHLITEKEIEKLDAWLGGILFSICHRAYWRKNIEKFNTGQKELRIGKNIYYNISGKGKGCVQHKEGTNKALSFPNLYFEAAPIALIGVSKYFSIDKSKINRLKNAAERSGYLEVEHSFEKVEIPVKDVKNYNVYTEEKYAKIKKGKVYTVEIDIVLPANLTKKQLKNNKKKTIR
jgi:hypothetical protein